MPTWVRDHTKSVPVGALRNELDRSPGLVEIGRGQIRVLDRDALARVG